MKFKRIYIFALMLLVVVFFQFGELFIKIKGKVEYTSFNQNTPKEELVELKDSGNTETTQSFIATENNISSMEVLMRSDTLHDPIVIKYGLRDLDGNDLYSLETEISLQDTEQYYKFDFGDIKINKGNKYYFYMTIPKDKSGEVIIYTSNAEINNEGNIYLNGEKKEGNLEFKITSKVAYPRRYPLMIIAITIIALGILYYLIKGDKGIKIEKVFLGITLIYGIILVFIIPPFQSPDEPYHFYRAFEISQGSFITQSYEEGVGSYLPRSVNTLYELSGTERIAFNSDRKVNLEEFKDAITLPLNKEDKIFYSYPNAAVYSPLQYLPQSIGIAIGSLLNLPVLFVFYLGRLANLLTWTIIVAYAIKLMPFGKNIIAIIGFIPICLQQAASMSSDTLLNAVALLFIAYILKYFHSKEKLYKKDTILLLLMIVFINLCKFVYFPLVFMLFLLPKESFNNNKSRIAYIIITSLLSILITGGWLLYMNNKVGLDYAPLQGVNTGEQIKYALTNPIRYAFTIRETFYNNLDFYIKSAIGYLGWLDNILPDSIIYSFFVTLIIVSITIERSKCDKLRFLSVSIFVLSTVLILSSLYATWTPVAQGIVDGVQGRYFIPLIPLLLLFLPSLKVQINRDNFNRYLYVYINWVYLYTMLIIVERYYI